MRQRGNGEGSIYQRADGRWAGSLSLGYVDGKPRRKHVYARTRAEVAARLTRLQNDVQRGLPVPDERLMVARFLETWLESIRPSVRPSTFGAYSSYVEHHLNPGLGRVKLSKLTPQQVEGFLADQEAAGLSPRTVNHMRTILRTALNRAMAWGLLYRNVAALAAPRHLSTTEPQVLTPQQAVALIDGVRADRLGALYITALTLGLRLGEALGLQWQDIDLQGGTLRVRQALQRSDGAAHFVEPKSQTSRRTVKLPFITHGALREHRRRQLEERLRARPEWNGLDLVFCTLAGRPLNPSSTTRRFRQVLADLGLPQMRFHDLRHSAATLLLAKGTHPRLVMELLGHSQVSLTLNTYSHVVGEMQDVTATQMDAVLQAAAGLDR